MLRFITGTAGTGKTVRLREEICRAAGNGESILVLVPEQYSFGTERALYRMLGAEKAMNVQVLSFTRLCNLIFREYGGLAGEVLEDTSRYLYMSLALSQCQEYLNIYADRLHGSAFISGMVAQISEFKNAGVRPEDLRRFGEEAPAGTLREKAEELALIYEAYQAYIDRGYLDPEDDLMRACKALEGQRFFEGVHVFIDAFKGFTAGEFRMLERILSQAEEVWMAAVTDSLYDHSHGFGLFVPVTDTTARLIRLAKEAGMAVAPPVEMLSPHRFCSPELTALERGVFRLECESWEEVPRDVALAAAADPYDELRRAAGEIGRLVREQGYRYRDILIVTRGLERYEQPLEDVFGSRSIPFFWDRREKLSDRPLAAALLCAVDAANLNMDTDGILRLVKTGLLGFSDRQASLLESYCFVWDIKGRMWAEPFRANPEGFGAMTEQSARVLEETELLRQKAAEPLLRLLERTKLCSGEGFAQALFDYMAECGMTEHLQNGPLAQDGEFMSREAAAYDMLLEILEQYAMALGKLRLPLARHAELFRLVVSAADMGRIPETLDQVAVGDAGRVRPDGPRAVFVIGANEGIFPAQPSGTGLLSDREREAMAEFGLELSGSSHSRSLEETYFAYTALTCASEKVFVSWPAADLRGNTLYPSSVVRQVEKVFPRVSEAGAADELEGVWNVRTAFEAFARRSKENSPQTAALLALLQERGRGEQARRALLPVSCGQWRMEDGKTAKQLFGARMQLSPSRLERYAQCRFAYFCAGGLGIKRLRKADFSPLESGSVIHYVLQCMVSKYSGKGLLALDTNSLRREIDKLIDDYLSLFMGGAEGRSARFRYLFCRLSDMLQKLVLRIAEEFSVSDFEPVEFELSIGAKGKVRPMELITASGARVSVEGVVDRVDTMEKNGRRYVRVVDYKSGTKTFDLCDVYYGINLQMLVYLFSICHNSGEDLSETVPAGVLYMPARTGSLSARRDITEEEAKRMRRQTLKMNGLLLDDLAVLQGMEHDLEGVFIPAKLKSDGSLDPRSSVASLAELGKIRRHVEKLICDMADTLRRGEVQALPVFRGDFDPCQHCEFRPVCTREEGDPQKTAEDMTRKEFFERIEEGEELGG